MFDAAIIKQHLARMKSARSGRDSLWGEIARLVYPEMDGFYGGGLLEWTRAGKVPEVGMHDPYAALALEDGVSLFEGWVMPRGKRWQTLALADEALMRSVTVQQWVEQVEIRLFALRGHPESGFVGAVHQSAMSLLSFGGQSMWVDIRRDGRGRVAGLSYQSEFIGEIYIDRDSEGQSLRIYREFQLTAEDAAHRFGDRTPEAVRKALQGPNAEPGKIFTFIHSIERNRAIDPERWDEKGKPWLACYVIAGGEDQVFWTGGYYSLPRVVSTFSTAVGSPWGFSPTMRVMPQIRLLQQIQADRVLGAEMRLKPPLLADDDEMEAAVIALRPFGVTYGGLDERGNPRLREFLTAADPTDAEKLADEARAAIDKAYGRDLLQLNREYKTHITATRTTEETAEKGVLLAPYGRQETEWLSPMTVRELSLLAELGGLNDAPGEVIEYLGSAGDFAWRYDNELSRFMKAQETASFLSLAEQVGVMAQYDQEWLGEFRRVYPPARVLPQLGENAQVPASMRATEDELRAYDEAKQREQGTQQLLAAVPLIADAAKNAAQAGALERSGNG